MLIRSRSLLLLAFGCGLAACILLLSSCGGTSNPAIIPSGAQVAATVAYRPPIIVHLTPTSGPKATATPRPSGPPPPTPTPPPPPPPGPSPAGHPAIPRGQL